MKTYKFYSDPGHAWLAVKRKELVELGILEQVSQFSYQNGGTVYLEEDCDAPLFIQAYTNKHGFKPKFDERHTDNDSPIRFYEPFELNEAIVNKNAFANIRVNQFAE